MKVIELIRTRQKNWQELEQQCSALERTFRRPANASTVARFAALYRAACADLALADSYQLPPGTVNYLHQLVGRAHNQLYRARAFAMHAWYGELFSEVPRRLYRDGAFRLALAIFWGIFLLSGAMAYFSPEFADQVLGKDAMMGLEEMYSEPVAGRGDGATGAMATGFYSFHNPSIGLRCFAFGLAFGIGGLFALSFNASILGAAFGFMARSPHAENFFHFVTAHGPFELTAIVLAAAAGMRLGVSLVDTGG
ncbi:MAG: stage II sporulation protein M [Patescibacteria group bacterium]|nr:stage II sporulation protein M [Patescibacteria group bacterium]